MSLLLLFHGAASGEPEPEPEPSRGGRIVGRHRFRPIPRPSMAPAKRRRREDEFWWWE